MALSEEKLKQVVQEATDAFWEVVANSFPEIKTGDFDPGLTFKQDAISEECIRAWYDWNFKEGGE